jgi:hypothetical protein
LTTKRAHSRSFATIVLILSLVFPKSELRAADHALIRPGDAWSYWKGTQPPPAGWSAPTFDDSGWLSGPSGFSAGFETYDEATVLSDLPSNYVSVFLRRPFILTNLADVVWPVLRIDYDDGFVAWLNGIEIARRGLPGVRGEPVPFDALAAPHPRGMNEEIDLRPCLPLFVTGTNVLALQVHNTTLADPTWAVVPELLSGITRGPFLQSTSSNQTLIVWKTAIPTDAAIAYGPTADLGQIKTDSTLTNTHVLQLTGLEADTRYFYRVTSSADGESVRSDLESFRTLKDSGAIRFLVVGDTGIGQPAQYGLARQMAGRDADFVLHVGDIVYREFTQARVDAKLFSVYGQMAGQPWFFAIGNHDLYAGESAYLEAFYLPTNSPAGGEHYYSFDAGDAHFCILMIPYLSQYQLTAGDAQYQWLTNDLATTAKPWKVLVHHVPMQTSGPHRLDDQNLNGLPDSDEIREVLLPVAARYGVQVTFCGHDHVFEKFAPTNGVHTVTSGGGGVGLYGLAELDAGSVQFWPRHHFTEVTVNGDRMDIRAIDEQGIAFDSLVIRRQPPADIVYPAAWHSPVVESAPPDDGDGNLTGQQFDLTGDPVGSQPGDFANLGELRVNNDKRNLYLGLSQLLLRSDSVVYVFVESPRLPGVTSLAGLGNGIIDPAGEGADGLDELENLSFSGFSPSLGLILGDETADTTYRSFRRPGNHLNTGQGAFMLNATLDDAAGVHIQQFNRSPQAGAVVYEQTADFIEISIPYATLGGLRPGDTVKLGVVVAGDGFDPATQHQRLDSAFLGIAMTGSGTHGVVLTGVRVQLAADPDRDGDGLPNDWELANGLNPDSAAGDDGATGDPDHDGATNLQEYLAGTNPQDPQSVLRLSITPLDGSQMLINWRTEAGLRYQLEAADDLDAGFQLFGGTSFPRTAAGDSDSFIDGNAKGTRVFRIKRLP